MNMAPDPRQKPVSSASFKPDLILPPEVWLVFARKRIIAACTAVAVLLGLLFVIFRPDHFTSSAVLMIDSRRLTFGADGAVLSESNLTDGLIDSQVEVLQSDALGLRVVDALDLDQDPEFVPEQPSGIERIKAILNPPPPLDDEGRRRTALRSYRDMLSAQRLGMTYAIELRLTTDDPAKSATVLQTLIDEYLRYREEQNAETAAIASGWLRDRARNTGPTAQVLNAPLPPIAPSGLGSIATLVAFAVLGTLAGLGLAVAATLTDRRIRTARELSDATGLPCIGVLPRIAPAGTEALRAALDAPQSGFSRTLQLVAAGLPSPGTIGIGSALAGEGKTTVAANLSGLVAQATGRAVLLVDAASVNPALSRRVARPRDGLADCVAGCPLDHAVVPEFLPGVDLLPFGSGDPKVGPLALWSAGMKELIAEMRGRYDVVIFDLSASAESIDLQRAAFMLDSLLLVVGEETAGSEELESVAAMPEVLGKVRGTILNTGRPRPTLPGRLWGRRTGHGRAP